jgi:ketopantoate hydroxymethyltransferase
MAKVFADAGKMIEDGLHQYVREATERHFPQPENWFGMPDDEYDELTELLEEEKG